ncbi:response regulator transcription factor [Mucilaginibacter rigui]|uniref:Response regulator transcription factor n=1 Tax=Mucilaginibacter rigui TaxID=534635 RepID=A0ABR7X7Y3_9SPHI|nr:LytTR family DNA-binding domain-containing protein [Mucilaginibacter rigui]MBD1386691.1 response regulator transcription factor [Mucilaginibacter rigui]
MKALRIVLIEDEPVTARNLAHILEHLDENISIISMLTGVKEAVGWFNAHLHHYDLVFMDIRLTDGLSFEIFKQARVNRPVIFVTAYNDYAIEAFKNNGIDYILKPFNEQEVARALQKFETLFRSAEQVPDGSMFTRLLEQFQASVKSYKKSFLVHYRDKLVPVETVKIAWFYTESEMVYGHTFDGKQYILDFTLEQLEQQLDPQLFFRANRQFIINRAAILEADFYFNGRLSVKVKPEPAERILISKARVPEFKSWMNT